MSEFQERRRTPRVAAGGQHEFRLNRRIRVRVLDISTAGALLAADDPLPVGCRGRLQISLGGAQFEGQALIKRTQRSEATREHLLHLRDTYERIDRAHGDG